MRRVHHAYLAQRGGSYMATETGSALGQIQGVITEDLFTAGYAGVALDLIEGLRGAGPRQMILNVPNHGALRDMSDQDVVETPTYVAHDVLRPLATGSVPLGPLSLMQQVKTYERLTIAAATEGSYAKALHALTIHPLVRDHDLARSVLHDYQREHAETFPALR
jgi:6-phospho-beta-glucosidase